MSRAKVLFISPTVAHYIGGTETVVNQLCQQFKRHVELTVLSGQRPDASGPLLQTEGLRLELIPFLGRERARNQLLRRLLLTNSFEIESRSFFASLARSGIDLNAFERIVTFAEVDARWLSKRYPALRSRCFHFLPFADIRLFKRVSPQQTFFFGYGAAPEVKRRWGIDIESLPLGVDASFVREAPDFPARKRLLYAGRVVPGKNVDWLVELFVSGKLAEAGFQLDVVGDGPLLEPLRARYASAPGLVFHGGKPQHEVAAMLHESLIFLHPTQAETFGLTILESLAAGVPVITHDLASIRVWAEDFPRYAQHLDRDAWLAAIHRLSEPAAWRTVSQRGQAHARRFTWQKVAEMMLVRLGMAAASRLGAQEEARRLQEVG